MLLTKDKDVNVSLNNVCEIWGQLIICNGNDTAGIHPNLGILNCNWDFKHIDSLVPDSIEFLEFADYAITPWDTKIMFLGNSNVILSYDMTYGNHYCDTLMISPKDTLYTDSVNAIRITPSMDGLAMLRSTSLTPNFIFYDTSLSVVFSLQLNMVPLLISIPGYSLGAAVVGVNQNNETVLNIIDLDLHQVVKDTILGPMAANPYTLSFVYPNLQLASSPGDSITTITKYSIQTGSITNAIAFSGSGINVADWEGHNLHFQPLSDTSLNALHRQVMVYNCSTMAITGTFQIDKRLKILRYPVNLGQYYYYMFAVSDSVPDVMYIYDYYNYNFQDSVITAFNPGLFLGDLRCPVRVDEYDDSMVDWTLFPNPSTGDFSLSASGLICGREYKMDIVDGNGKILYENTVHAKMTVTLPTAHFESGIYYVRIHTLKGFITQEIIKQ